MGGIGSGNHGGEPTVEDSLVLDLNRLIRQGTFKPGCAWGGSIVWTEVSSGQPRRGKALGFPTIGSTPDAPAVLAASARVCY